MNFGDTSLPERFWAKVIPEPNSGCFLWIGSIDHKGYGKFWYKGKSRKAHRIVGHGPEGKRFRRTADHKCCVTNCVNPLHLQDVSRAKNSRLKHARLNRHL